MTGSLAAGLLVAAPARHLLQPGSGARPRFTSDAPPEGRKGRRYDYRFVASGHPHYSVASGKLPSGLTLHPHTGVLSGTPRKVGTATFTVRATDSAGSATTHQRLHVEEHGRSPVNIDRPKLSNMAPRVGETISVSTGTWS
jgi:hypothetical protein